MSLANLMNKSLVSVSPNTSVRQAAEIMAEKRIGSLLVVEGEELVGIITETDLIKKVLSKSLDTKKTKISSVMTRNVITINVDSNLQEACRLMRLNHIKKLPVVENGKPVGIITTTDIVSHEPQLARYLSKEIAEKQEKKTKKLMKPILLTNALLASLLLISVFIFLSILQPLMANSSISKEAVASIYFLMVFLIIISSISGILIFKIVSRKSL